jgi:hypothetical protein
MQEKGRYDVEGPVPTQDVLARKCASSDRADHAEWETATVGVRGKIGEADDKQELLAGSL